MSELEKHSLTTQSTERRRGSLAQTLVAIPAAVLPLLPCPPCPLCLAAYAGVLSSLGLGFLLNDQVQRPLIVVFLCITLVSVGWATKRHRTYGPIALVSFGVLSIVTARIVWDVRWVVYVGAACVITGALWNLILKRRQRGMAHVPVESIVAGGEPDQ